MGTYEYYLEREDENTQGINDLYSQVSDAYSDYSIVD